jgi:hypothetical protein
MGSLTRVALAGSGLCALLSMSAVVEAGPPAQLAVARYVALGYDRGDRFVSEIEVREGVLPEERAALQMIRAGIEQWGKYLIAVRPGQAELLIAVRKGRLVSLGGRTGGPSSGEVPGGRVRSAWGAGVQVSSPDDILEVFDARDGSLIWRGMKPNGLSGAGPPLFDSLRAEVAKAERVAQKP